MADAKVTFEITGDWCMLWLFDRGTKWGQFLQALTVRSTFGT
jgi:hypothetical protein